MYCSSIRKAVRHAVCRRAQSLDCGSSSVSKTISAETQSQVLKPPYILASNNAFHLEYRETWNKKTYCGVAMTRQVSYLGGSSESWKPWRLPSGCSLDSSILPRKWYMLDLILAHGGGAEMSLLAGTKRLSVTLPIPNVSKGSTGLLPFYILSAVDWFWCLKMKSLSVVVSCHSLKSCTKWAKENF